MSTKISDLADQLNLSSKELKEKIVELGFEVSPRARVLDDELAELILGELSDADNDVDHGDDTESDGGVADIYDELIDQEQQREIIKSQRKRTAGKVTGSKSKGDADSGHESGGKKSVVEIPDVITVKEFAEKTGINATKVIGELMKNGVLANINQPIDFETIQVISEDLGVKVKRLRGAAEAEEFMSGDISKLLEEDDSSDLEERPPVVVVMGHVDHGKTQLLDTIRQASVVAQESGGITQHMAAYQVEKKGKLITFLDTPGHEAFTAMRARGAKVTDIAILVVAADEGVKPQTLEALNHAREAKVPIVVAINKMDKPNANPDKVKGELAEHGLQAEDWGGDTVMVPISALTGDGIDDLLDMLILTSEMLELKANPNREAVATVIEAHLDKSLGPVATVLVNTGTLKIMNTFVVGETYGRIKLMQDHKGTSLRVAGPAKPVLIAGLNDVPKSGDILQVVKDEKTAREKAEEIGQLSKSKNESSISAVGQLISQVQSEKQLKIILKADAKGSIEAIKQSLTKIKDEEVAVKIIHSGLGTITESDVMMAAASRGVVLAFHSKFYSPHVKKIAEREGVEVRQYSVIYDLIEDVKLILSGLIEPELFEVELGRLSVKQIFFSKKKDMIIGCKVESGVIENKAMIKVVRGKNSDGEDNIVGRGVITNLKKVSEVVKSVKAGNECGIKYQGDTIIEEGDELVAYKEEEKIRTIQ